MLHTLSGGEQKRLALEALLRGPDEVLLLDEPDNYLDVPGKRWLEASLAETPKTARSGSHDRQARPPTPRRAAAPGAGRPRPGRGGRCCSPATTASCCTARPTASSRSRRTGRG